MLWLSKLSRNRPPYTIYIALILSWPIWTWASISKKGNKTSLVYKLVNLACHRNLWRTGLNKLIFFDRISVQRHSADVIYYHPNISWLSPIQGTLTRNYWHWWTKYNAIINIVHFPIQVRFQVHFYAKLQNTQLRSSNDAATRTQIVAPKREDNQVLASADFGLESVLECPLEQEARALMALVPTETVMLRRWGVEHENLLLLNELIKNDFERKPFIREKKGRKPRANSLWRRGNSQNVSMQFFHTVINLPNQLV